MYFRSYSVVLQLYGFRSVNVAFFCAIRCVVGRPFATLWQTTSCCRGRFIVPAYMKTPTKWGTNIRVWRFEYTYFKMWTYVCDEMNIWIW